MSDWCEKVVEKEKRSARRRLRCISFPLEGGLEWTLAVDNNITNAFRLCFFLCLRRCKRKKMEFKLVPVAAVLFV